MNLENSVHYYTHRNIWNAAGQPIDDIVHKYWPFSITQAICRVMEKHVYELNFDVSEHTHAFIKKL